MEKRKIAINREMAVYLKNASNAFVKYVDILRDYTQHNNIKIEKVCMLHNNIKIRKERHYAKIIFWGNIDRVLNMVGAKKYDINTLSDIINFILEHNYVAHEYYDTYVALHPWMCIYDFYKYDSSRKRVIINRKNMETRGEIFQSMVESLDTYYIGYGGTPLIKRMIGKEI